MFQGLSGRSRHRNHPTEARPALLQFSLPCRSFPLDGSLGGVIDGLLIDLKCWARALQAFDFPLQFSDSAACLIEAADFLLRFMRQVRKLAENRRELPAMAPAR